MKLKSAALIIALLLTCAAIWTCVADTTTAPSTNPATKKLEPPDDMHFDSTTLDLKGKPFTIEIANSDARTQRGLMYRKSMPADHGMLFIFDEPAKLSFWMKNTQIPLDIIFLDKNCKVLEVQARKPLDETGGGPDAPAQYVIELNVGRAGEIGLKPGDVVAIPEKYLKRSTSGTEK